MAHIPVMLEEVIKQLDIKMDGTYLDLTVGYGGHASEILKRIPQGFLIGVDRDKEAIKNSQLRLAKLANNFELIHGDFASIDDLLSGSKHRSFDGILADLGVSSPQIDDPSRGFQYKEPDILDMRLDQDQLVTASMLLEDSNESKLREIFSRVLSFKLAGKIANIIIRSRPIVDGKHLAKLIRDNLPSYIVRRKNPLKPIFLALRIAVNDEIGQLERLTKSLPRLLKDVSNLVFISFNSLEDRLVKQIFSELRRGSDNYRGLASSRFSYQTKTI